MDIPEVSETELADTILRSARRLRRANAEELEGLPLNPHQARALRVVGRLEPVRMADLAERLHVAPRSATEVVEFLVAGGWVERVHDPDDRRTRAVRLTGPGRALLTDVEDARARAARAVLGHVRGQEGATIASALGRIVGTS